MLLRCIIYSTNQISRISWVSIKQENTYIFIYTNDKYCFTHQTFGAGYPAIQEPDAPRKVLDAEYQGNIPGDPGGWARSVPKGY